MISTRIYLNHRDLDIYNWNQAQVKQFNAGSFTTIWMIVVVKNHDVLTNMICMINIKEILWLYDVVFAYIINPCSPEGFSQTYFPKGGCCNPPLDYLYWRSYNPKFTTSV